MIRELESLEYKMIGRSPEQNMNMLMGRYQGPSIIVPTPDKYYTFVYTAKTKGIEYDQHPVIRCSSVFSWGFIGFNTHWGEARRYTWTESSNLLELSEGEFEVIVKLPLARYKVS